ncbi:MAG: collagen-like triple helix repeat-containing protein [Corticimicrobacter sp.]|uniref:collagen-like triple helix repeat-containing protein n=1 Tax=Corticimicrobacter sp. TaxID=2678536 RepID=UPI0032DA3A23
MSRIASPCLAPLFRKTLAGSLLLAAFALAGCASSGSRDSSSPTPTNPGTGTPAPTLPGDNDNGGNNGGGTPPGNGGNPGGGTDNGGGGGNTPQAGAVETLLGNTGTITDNLAGTSLGGPLTDLGNSIDPLVEPVLSPLTQLTQRIGADTGLGAPINDALGQTGNLLGQTGQALGSSGLPLNLDSGAEGLLTGLGDTVASLGGLLHATPGETMPLATTLGHATGALDALASALVADGGLLQPLAAPLQNLTTTLMPPGQTVAILEPALGNTGAALDNLVPLNLGSILGNTGAVLDQAAVPAGMAVVGLTQQVGAATGLALPADQVLGSLGNALSTAGGQLDQALPVGGIGHLVQQVGAGIASTGGVLNPNHAQAGNPLGATLGHVTHGVAGLTSGLAQGLGQGLTGSLTGNPAQEGTTGGLGGLLGGGLGILNR